MYKHREGMLTKMTLHGLVHTCQESAYLAKRLFDENIELL